VPDVVIGTPDTDNKEGTVAFTLVTVPVPYPLGLDAGYAPKLVNAAIAVVALVPPLAIPSVPASVIVPEVVTGPPDVVKPVVPPDTSIDVTVPDPPPPPVLALLSRFKKNLYQSRDTMPVRSSVIDDWFLGICGVLSGLGIGA
jgi:hypothetical protein